MSLEHLPDLAGNFWQLLWELLAIAVQSIDGGNNSRSSAGRLNTPSASWKPAVAVHPGKLLPKVPGHICTMFSGRPINILLRVSLMISVLIIDDHPIALQGCRRVLEDAGVGPIFCATDLDAAYLLFLSHRPDVAIVDLAFAGDSLGGLGFVRRIKASPKEIPIVVFSMHDDPAIIAQALEAGASSYVLKDAHSEELIKAVHRVSTSPPFTCAHDALRVAFNESRAASRLAADTAPQGSDTFAP